MCCAAAAGNIGVLKQLVALRADVDERVPKKCVIQDLFLLAG